MFYTNSIHFVISLTSLLSNHIPVIKIYSVLVLYLLYVNSVLAAILLNIPPFLTVSLFSLLLPWYVISSLTPIPYPVLAACSPAVHLPSRSSRQKFFLNIPFCPSSLPSTSSLIFFVYLLIIILSSYPLFCPLDYFCMCVFVLHITP